MVKQKYGRIISVSSVQGFASSGMCGAYNASKGGIIAFTKSMAVELAPYNILVNAVAPGFMQHPMSIVNGVDETTPRTSELVRRATENPAGAHRLPGGRRRDDRIPRLRLLPLYDRAGAGRRRRA